MEAMKQFQRLFAYDYWANRRALESLSTISDSDERPRKIMGHIMGAQRVWLGRFDASRISPAEPWPTLTIAELDAAIEHLHKQWSDLLGSLTPERLVENLVYRNAKGVEFQTPVEEVLLHLVMHAAYHRGQMATAVRDAGGKPAPTDYVVYVRELHKA